jgi:hypothetical protein
MEIIGIYLFREFNLIFSSFYGLVHMSISVFLLSSILSNYLFVVFTDPGKPPSFDALQFSQHEIETLKNGEVEVLNIRDCDFRYCKLCMFLLTLMIRTLRPCVNFQVLFQSLSVRDTAKSAIGSLSWLFFPPFFFQSVPNPYS